MTGSRCCYDVEFDDRAARRELDELRQSGPRRTTRRLADALAGDDPRGLSVLDVGGGVGALHQLLLRAGVASVVDVDASGPYLRAAEAEANRLGFGDRAAFVHGDFVVEASAIEVADVVGLDRVACCYPDVSGLIGAAAAHARRRLGIVVPPDGTVARLVIGAINVWQRIIRSDLRLHAHPHVAIARVAEAAGLHLVQTESIGVWRLLVFERQAVPQPAAS